MSLYLNCRFEDGDKLALEIGTPKGVADFLAWTRTLPREFAAVRDFAQTGKANGSKQLRDELRQAVKAKKPNPSAAAVAARLIDVLPHEGVMEISDEPEDDEFDDEDEDE